MKKIFFIAAGAAVLIASVFIYFYFLDAGESGRKKTLPDFSLQDINGKEWNSQGLRGRNLIINSWATWCPYCMEELKDFARLQEKYSDKILILAVDRGESMETVKKYAQENELSERLNFLLDLDDSFYQDVGGFSMPETVFVNSSGEIIFHKRGPMKFEEIEEKINLFF